MSQALAVAAMICGLIALSKLYATCRSRDNPALRAMTVGFAALAAALGIFIPSVYAAFDRVVGVPNLAEFVGHALVLVSAYQARQLLLNLTRSPTASRGTRWQAPTGLTLSVGVMGLFFALAPVDVEAPGTFTHRYAGAAFIAPYWTVFLAYLTVTLGHVIRLCWRYSNLSPRPFLRLGLRIVAAGGLVGLGYFAHWGLFLLLHRFGVTPPESLESTTRAVALMAVALCAVGATIPSWGRRFSEARVLRWRRQRASYARLAPLWRDLTAAAPPETALAAAVSEDEELVQNLEFRLRRRIIEIRDARRTLARWMRPQAAEAARDAGRRNGLTGEALLAFVEAASLLAAIDIMRSGRPPRDDPALPPVHGGADLASEAAWLGAVSDAYRSTNLRLLREGALTETAGLAAVASRTG